MSPQALPAVALGDAAGSPSEEAGETLLRIRNEELSRILLLTEAIKAMGADPAAMTPCAGVGAVQSMGFMQVLNDLRTTLA